MEPGHVLGRRFVIIGELGKGSMATVYLAEDKVRGTRIALKVLHEHLADDEDARARLTREVRAAGRIQHPNALVAHDIHDLDGRLALSMPVHRGMTLAERVETDGPLSGGELDQLARDLTGALAAAHATGIIHRDVSPNNILVERGGSAVLADFGLARIEGHGTRTSTGGTWGYAAPEVFQGAAADPRSDVYSLGAVLYFAATGTAPFAASNPGSILRRQLEGEFTPLADLRPYLPSELTASIENMLALDPDDRAQGAREAKDLLEAGEAPVVETVEPSTELDVGMYTLVIARRNASPLRRKKGPIGADEDAEAERRLAALLGQSELPAVMRRREFKLVEGVSHAVAEHLANEAIRLGFAPRIVNDPHVRWSKDTDHYIVPPIFMALFGVVGFLVGGEEAIAPLLVAGVLSVMASVPAMFYAVEQRRLHLAYARALPEIAPKVTVAHSDPLLRMHAKTRARLAVLERAMAEENDIAEALQHRISATLAALVKRADALVEPAERLGADLEAESDQSDAVRRIQQRLARLDTLERAGEFVDAGERKALDEGLAAHRESQRLRDEAEVMRTRIAARLLEIGAAATRATRALKRDGDLAGSVRELLEQLVAESEAAAAVIEEIEAPRRPRRPMLTN
ncbi:MAG: serine/threonine protein kinase [Proteobacteria bacterium]|nr:serine/threonine protein kinase [Pseudomonadota bacterium]